MIHSFRSKALRRFAEQGDASKLSVPNVRRVETILARLEAALSPEDLNLPGYRWHGLKGRDKGRYAVDASGNWRITFAWEGRNAIDVDLEDYH
ncbi:MAG: type II toxin-antitoxin system RelE/ParE family toxin [Sphingorhabdus sp.]